MKKFIVSIAVCAVWLLSGYQSAAAEPPYNTPYYFGPNAYPVPELASKPFADIRAEAGTRLYFRQRNDYTDYTANTLIKVNVPLWTPRANFSVWANVREFYWSSEPCVAPPGLTGEWHERTRCGSTPGDIYVSTDMLVLQEGRYRPDVILRATLKTASGDDYEYLRHYDSAGYNFDLTVAKTFGCGEWTLRPALMAGFLCWQTRINQQDDALLYGLQCGASWRRLTIKADVAGYDGRFHDDDPVAHDSPMVARASVQYGLGRWTVSGQYEHGLQDFPYNSVSVCLALNI